MPTTGITSRPAFRKAAVRVRPWVIIHDMPSRRPAPADSTMAVSSNGPCAVTKLKKFVPRGDVGASHIAKGRAERNRVEHGHEHSGHDEQSPGEALQADARVVLRVEARP